MKILIKNAWIITGNSQNPVIPSGYITIEDNEILAVQAGDCADQSQFQEVIDAGHKIVAPGLINAHMHCYSTFARGMSLAGTAPSCFVEILEKLWWRLDKRLEKDDLYLSTLIPILEGIRSGVTTFIDHHASPMCIPGCLDELERAFEFIGMRGILCYEVSDRDGSAIAQKGIEENIRFIQKANARPNGLVKGTFGLHASFTVSDATMRQAVAAAQGLGVGLHLHVAEDHADQTLTISEHHKRVVHRLADLGVLGPKSIAAHGVWIDDEEKQLLAQSKTAVIHNPRSNMNNAVGAMDLLGLLKYGAIVGLGTDGMAGALWPDLRTAALIHKHEHRNPRVVWAELNTLLANNSQIANQFFSKPLGKIMPGAYPDIVIYDYEPPTPMHQDNILGHFLFGFAHVQAQTVIINGKLVLRDHQFVDVSTANIAASSRIQAEKFWKRFAV